MSMQSLPAGWVREESIGHQRGLLPRQPGHSQAPGLPQPGNPARGSGGGIGPNDTFVSSGRYLLAAAKH